MEKEKARDYLETISQKEKQIAEKKEKIDALKSRAVSLKGVNYDSVHVQTDKQKDPVTGTVDSYTDLENELFDDLIDLWETRHKIIGQIQQIENLSYSDLLYKRYVEHKKLEDISKETGYSYQYTRRIHGKALEAFGKLFDIIE